jgi:hypothetical protein
MRAVQIHADAMPDVLPNLLAAVPLRLAAAAMAVAVCWATCSLIRRAAVQRNPLAAAKPSVTPAVQIPVVAIPAVPSNRLAAVPLLLAAARNLAVAC